eukprot:17643-Heterococcus_DN1.PRE.3
MSKLHANSEACVTAVQFYKMQHRKCSQIRLPVTPAVAVLDAPCMACQPLLFIAGARLKC